MSLFVDLSIDNDAKASKDELAAYKSRIGSINFPAAWTRPDVAKCVSVLSTITNPGRNHFRAADGVIRYMLATKDLGICFGHSAGAQGFASDATEFIGASDASFADYPSRKSSEG